MYTTVSGALAAWAAVGVVAAGVRGRGAGSSGGGGYRAAAPAACTYPAAPTPPTSAPCRILSDAELPSTAAAAAAAPTTPATGHAQGWSADALRTALSQWHSGAAAAQSIAVPQPPRLQRPVAPHVSMMRAAAVAAADPSPASAALLAAHLRLRVALHSAAPAAADATSGSGVPEVLVAPVSAVASTRTLSEKLETPPSNGATPEPSGPAPTDAVVVSFKGNPHELQDRLRGANVLVFFYKAPCGPCAAIRSKLFHAVASAGGIVGAAPSAGPETATDTAAAPAADQPAPAGASSAPSPASASISAHTPHTSATAPADAASATRLAAAEPGVADAYAAAPSPTAPPSSPALNAVASSSSGGMSAEDQRACDAACRSLSDVARAFPRSVILLTVDTNENAKVTALHDIRSLPTFIAYRDGCMAGRVEGAHEAEVHKLVQLLTSGPLEEEEAAQGSSGAAVPATAAS